MATCGIASGALETKKAFEEILAEPEVDTALPAGKVAPRWQRVLPWLLIPIVAFGVWWMRPDTAPSAAGVVRSQIVLPEGTRLLHGFRKGVAVSPDGTRVAFAAGELRESDDDEEPPPRGQIWLRAFDQWQARPVPGTEGAVAPVFSPDGEWLLFSNESGLHKVDLTGGDPIRLCESDSVYGTAWGPNGIIAFSTQRGAVMGVSSQGGEATPLTRLDASSGEKGHYVSQFLPGGRTLLLTAIMNWYFDWSDNQIVAWSLDTGERTVLVENASDPRYVAGYLLFAREGNVLAAPFDPQRLELTGEAVPVLQGVNHSVFTGSSGSESGVAQFDVSPDGTLVYAAGSVFPEHERSIYRVDRNGTAEKLGVEARRFGTVRLSPGGRELLLATHYPPEAAWIYDLERGTLRRQTFEGMTIYAVWGPGENDITFHSNRDGPINLYTRQANASTGTRRLTDSPYDHRPGSWSPDGRAFAYVESHPDTRHDIVIQSEDSPEPTRFVASDASESYPYFSPDGNWLAYGSNHSGRTEIYIRPYPGPGEAVLVSRKGGTEPAWSHDGSELYYRAEGAMWAVPLTPSGDRILPGRPVRLFDAGLYSGLSPTRSYDVAPDGRFIMVGKTENEDKYRRLIFPDRLRVVQEWVADVGLAGGS